MAKHIGWDVGIKNLASCVITKTETSFTVNNNEWIITDLTDSNLVKCCGILKNKNACEAGGKFYCNTLNGVKYFCGIHKSQYNDYKVGITELEKKYVELSVGICDYKTTRQKKVCGGQSKYIVGDYSCCDKHKNVLMNELVKEYELKPIKNSKCTNIDPQDLCKKMYNKLDEIDYLKSMDKVYIENQPSLLNPTMKTASAMLFSYFVFFNKANNLNMIIKFVSPGAKIKLDNDMINFTNDYIKEHNSVKREDCKCRICKLEIELKANREKFKDLYAKYKFNYDSVKELGIIYTTKILKDNNMHDNLTYLNTHDKKDDLCDAFLHAYRNMNKKN